MGTQDASHELTIHLQCSINYVRDQHGLIVAIHIQLFLFEYFPYSCTISTPNWHLTKLLASEKGAHSLDRRSRLHCRARSPAPNDACVRAEKAGPFRELSHFRDRGIEGGNVSLRHGCTLCAERRTVRTKAAHTTTSEVERLGTAPVVG